MAGLADLYARTADVTSRGYSGYTSRAALALVPDIFPAGASPADLVVLWFGTNDASLPGTWA